MTFWHRWRETRARFLILAALTLVASAMVAGNTPEHVAQKLQLLDATGRAALRLHRIDSEWFGNKGPSVMILLGAIFLVVGGVPTEPGRGSALFTLALPVTRRRLLANQLGVAAALVAGLSLVGVVGALLGAAYVGVSYPLAPALAGALVQTVGVLPFTGLLLALQTATRRAVGSAVALLGAAVIGPPMLSDAVPAGALRAALGRYEFPPMPPWEPDPGLHTLHGGALLAALPWGTLAAALAIAATASAVAFLIFERREP